MQLASGVLPIRMNQILLEIRGKAMNIVFALNDEKTAPTFAAFKQKWDVVNETPKALPSFYQLGVEAIEMEYDAKEISKNTRDAYFLGLKTFNQFRPNIDVDAITRADVMDFKAMLIKSKSDNAANQYTHWIKIIFRKIAKNHKVNHNPFEHVTISVNRISEKKTLTVEEYRKIYDFFKTCTVPKDREILRRFLVMCRGIRFSDTNEISKTAHYREISKDGVLLRYIVKPAQKTKVSGILPITDEDAEWLIKWNDEGLLFRKTGYENYSNNLKALSKAIIGRTVSTHYGRHFAGNYALNEMGLSLDEVQTVLGLTSKDMTKIYAEYNKLSILQKIYNSEGG